ncbi:MAG TPA: hypothetical protein VFP15_06455, partial [Gemmatimonadaceae bacterium]|nr:hypothetical protein [Gemmatimonadaceae bacterium]
ADVEDGSIMPGESELPFDGSIPGVSAGLGLATAAQLAGLSIGGPKGITYSGPDQGALPNLGTSPSVQLRSQTAGRTKGILQAIAARVGKHVALHSIALLVGKYGLPAVSAAFGIGAEDLLFLIAQYTVKRGRRGRRGPHLHTVLKRIKRAERYKHMLRHYASLAGIHRHHAAPVRHRKSRKR